jgi:hypothetical protein
LCVELDVFPPARQPVHFTTRVSTCSNPLAQLHMQIVL